MKAALFLLILFLIPVLPAFAAETSPVGEAGTARITDLYSDLESFDVTLYSGMPSEALTLEALLIKPVGRSEEVLSRQVFSVDSLPANTRVIRVGFWDVRNAERGAYTFRARLLREGQVLSEAENSFVYASNSVSRLRINDIIPNSEGLSVALSPVEAVLFDIEYMLVDGQDVVYTTKTEKASLTSTPETFSAAWGTLLENNREYFGRVKVKVYSPDKEFLVSTESFAARDDAEITDIFKDETGASATVFGRSQVPFEGSLVFTVYELQTDAGAWSSEPVESIREKVPVLLSGDDETVEVAWKQRLSKGVYKLDIELFGNDGDVIERRETIIESDLSSSTDLSAGNDSGTGTPENGSGNGIPGFSVAFGIAGLAVVSTLFRKQN